MGRRKLEMRRIENDSSRLVTFSKRRSGLFKKANEISTLCGVEVAVVIFSPGGKPFSFGQPNVEKVVHRFQNKNQQQYYSLNGFTPKTNQAKVNKLNHELANLDAQIELENKTSGTLDKKVKKWQPIEELHFNQITKLQKKLLDLFEGSRRRVNELEASNSLLLLANGVCSK